MDEQDFGKKVAGTLDWGLSRIEDDKLARLHSARQKAMAAYRAPVKVLGLVTVSGQTLDVSTWLRKPLFWLPVLAIALAVFMYAGNTGDEDTDAVGELDAKLLTGELPIDAFLDKDFASWVKESS